MTTIEQTQFVPLPALTPDNAPFWEACERHELLLQRCDDCQAFRFLPRPGCPSCGSPRTTWQPAPQTGHIYSYTTTYHQVHPAFGDTPYAVAVVELDEVGVRMITRIVETELDDIAIGAHGRIRFWDVGGYGTLPYFKLDSGAAL